MADQTVAALSKPMVPTSCSPLPWPTMTFPDGEPLAFTDLIAQQSSFFRDALADEAAE